MNREEIWNREELLNELVEMLVDKVGLPKDMMIDENTRMEEDLSITGDDAWEFFVDYSKNFDIDISNFRFSDYFESEGIDFISPILELFRLKKKRVKKEFLVAYLILGVEAGKLDSEVFGR